METCCCRCWTEGGAPLHLLVCLGSEPTAAGSDTDVWTHNVTEQITRTKPALGPEEPGQNETVNNKRLLTVWFRLVLIKLTQLSEPAGLDRAQNQIP